MLAEQVVALVAAAGLVLLPASVLGQITENAIARVELTPAEVEEGGFTTACAVYSGFEGPTELLLLTIGAASANPVERYGSVDYESVSVTWPALNDTEGRRCFNVLIFEDTLIENTEVFSVAIFLNGSYEDIQNVAIIDNDGSFAFDQAHYTVGESAGSITVCANLSIPANVSEIMTLETDLKLFAANETRDLVAAPIALAGEDYTRVSDSFTASDLTSRRCIDIPIIDDNDREPNERFAVILRVARSLLARDFEAVASVEIEDDDSGPLSISFTGDTPRVEGNRVTVEISLSRRTRSATCRLGDTEIEECFTGTTFRDVPPGRHTIRIEAMNNRQDRATATRKIEIGSGLSFCSSHLINDGVTVDGNTVTVEFGSVGLALSFSCQLDSQPSFSCTSPVVLEDVDAGLHRLRITAGGRFLCSTMRRQVIRFVVPRQDAQ